MSTVSRPTLETERIRRRPIEDVLDALQLDEVVARTESAELTGAAVVRPCRDGGGIGSREASSGLGAFQVVLGPDPAADEDARPEAQNVVQHPARESKRAVPAGAGRNRPRDLVHEPFATPTELVLRQRQDEQPDAAVDVVADAAGRDDPVGERRRGDASHREAVALVDIGHRERSPDDARQRGDVLQLLERAVREDRFEKLAVGEDTRRHPHVGPRLCRDLPERLVEAAQLRRRGRRGHARDLLLAGGRGR